MFNVDDRVRLKKDVGAFRKGCEGKVSMVVNQDIVVLIDKDELGNDVEPFPLPPLSAKDYFKPC